MDDLLMKPFQACVTYFPDGDYTEVVLRDVPTVYRGPYGACDLGYDMETGELVAVRFDGDKSKR